MKRLSILMVFLSYSGQGFSKSGGDTFFIEISRRLLSKGHKVSILTTPNGAKLIKNEKFETAMYIIKMPLIGRIPFFFDYIWRVFLCILKIKPSRFLNFDLIISTSPLFPDIIISYFLSVVLKAKPVIYHHGFVTPLMLSRYNLLTRFLAISIQRKFLTQVLKGASYRIFALPTVKEELLNLGISRRMIRNMSNGIDTKVIDQIKAKQLLFDGVFMGSLIPRKGIFDLPEIWKKVTEVFSQANLAIIGTGSPKIIYKLKKIARKRNVNKNLIFLGSILGPQKYVLLKSSKVFVFPSYSESWAISITEAMYCGLPCVVYNLKAYDIYGNGIIRIVPGDIEEFANAIIELLSDDKLRRKIGKKARQIASRFAWDEIFIRHERDLREIAGESLAFT